MSWGPETPPVPAPPGLPCSQQLGSKRCLRSLLFKGRDPGKRDCFFQMPFGVFLSSDVGLLSARHGANAGTQPEIPYAFSCVSSQVSKFLKHQNTGFLFSFPFCIFNSIPPSIWARRVHAEIAVTVCFLGIRLWGGRPFCPASLPALLTVVCTRVSSFPPDCTLAEAESTGKQHLGLSKKCLLSGQRDE